MNTDMSKVEAFAGQVVTDIAAAFSGVMTNIGHRPGLYKALAGAGWVTSNQLADKTGTDERYVREWLNNQAAGGYLAYDPKNRLGTTCRTSTSRCSPTTIARCSWSRPWRWLRPFGWTRVESPTSFEVARVSRGLIGTPRDRGVRPSRADIDVTVAADVNGRTGWTASF